MLLLLIFYQIVITLQQNEETIQYYENIITRAWENGATYQLPVNAYEYYSNSTLTNYGRFDFVVIGSGSGGSVVANRLSEIRNWSVLLLETGEWGDNLTNIPNMYPVMGLTNYNWGYNSTPQKTICLGMVNDVCSNPRGKGIGGTALMNGLVYSRGYKYDYDIWEKTAGHRRWGFESVLQYFKKSENFVHNDPSAPYEPSYHSTGGYLQVEYHKPRSPLLNRFLDANVEYGFKIVDYNANKLGASMIQQTTKNGKRWDGGNAFVRPVANRTNLKIVTGAYVTKISINENKVAVGVEFTHNGQNYFVGANKEVILSAGTIISPKILMHSGVGPEQHLSKLGIKVIHDLVGVGSALRDHTAATLSFETTYTESDKTLGENVRDYLKGRGFLTAANNFQGLGFYESSYTKGTQIPDIELVFMPPRTLNNLMQRYFGLTDQLVQDLWKDADPTKTFVVNVVALHTRSFGDIRLSSKDPFEYPLINTNLLTDPENRDIDTLYEGVQLMLNLTKTETFRSINTTMVGGPLTACKQFEFLSKDYWFCALRQSSLNFEHPVGTCAMGNDPKKGAVVDWQLKVFGIEGLRVADASVIPFTMACHTNAPSFMIGEQLADLIKHSYNED